MSGGTRYIEKRYDIFDVLPGRDHIDVENNHPLSKILIERIQGDAPLADILDTIRQLQEAKIGLDEEVATYERITPLIAAIRKNNMDVVNILLENGANPNDITMIGENAFFTAVENGNIPVIARLLESRASPNLQINSQTALYYAPNLDIFIMLMNAGLDPRHYTIDNGNILHSLAKRSDPEAIEMARLVVERGVDVNQIKGHGITPMHIAAKAGNLDMLKFLESVGAKVNGVGYPHTMPPLGMAVDNKPPSMLVLEWFINNQDVNLNFELYGEEFKKYLKNKTKQRGLSDDERIIYSEAHKMVIGQKPRKVEIPNFPLLNKDEVIDQQLLLQEIDELIHTDSSYDIIKHALENALRAGVQMRVTSMQSPSINPLLTACEKGRIDIVNLLLDHDACVVGQKYDKVPPISLAVKSGSIDIVRRLLDAGANIFERDVDGCTPLFYATNMDMFEFLLGLGLNIRDKDNYQSTVFHYAAFSADLQIFNRLVSSCSPHVQNIFKETPMHFAGDACSIEKMTILEASGADINHQAMTGTPLCAVLYSSNHENKTSAYQWLLDHPGISLEIDSKHTTIHEEIKWRLEAIRNDEAFDDESKKEYNNLLKLKPKRLAGGSRRTKKKKANRIRKASRKNLR